MNAQVKFISCDVYKRGIFVFIGTLSQLQAWAKNKFTDEMEKGFLQGILSTTSDSWAAAEYFFYETDGEAIVRIDQYPKTPKQYEELIHELLHATFCLLGFCGVEYVQGGSNEAYTYLLGHLTRNALEKEGYEQVK